MDLQKGVCDPMYLYTYTNYYFNACANLSIINSSHLKKMKTSALNIGIFSDFI